MAADARFQFAAKKPSLQSSPSSSPGFRKTCSWLNCRISVALTRRTRWWASSWSGWSSPAAAQHFGEGPQGQAVEVVDPLGLVRDHQRALAQCVLGGDAGRAAVGVAGARLHAADREHEAARGVGPIRADRQHAGDVEGADDLAGDAQLDPFAQASADQGVVHEQQTFAHRGADVIAELGREPRRCPPSAPSTTMKSATTPVSSIALTKPMNSQGWPTHSLNPTGLPPLRVRSWVMKAIISSGVEKALWRGGEMQSWPSGTPRVRAISGVTFAAGSTPPWPGLAPWLSLISIIFTWSCAAAAAKRSGLKWPSSVRQPK